MLDIAMPAVIDLCHDDLIDLCTGKGQESVVEVHRRRLKRKESQLPLPDRRKLRHQKRLEQRPARPIADSPTQIDHPRSSSSLPSAGCTWPSEPYVAPYLDNIMSVLRTTETAHMVPDDYLEQRLRVDWRSRTVLIDWITLVHSKFRLKGVSIRQFRPHIPCLL